MPEFWVIDFSCRTLLLVFLIGVGDKIEESFSLLIKFFSLVLFEFIFDASIMINELVNN